MFHRREFAQVNRRLDRIEQMLEAVMGRLEIDPAEVGVPAPPAVSPRVRMLAAEGRVLQAVKQLRDERPELDLRAATELVRSLG